MCKIVKGPPVRFYLVFFSVGAKMIFNAYKPKKTHSGKLGLKPIKVL